MHFRRRFFSIFRSIRHKRLSKWDFEFRRQFFEITGRQLYLLYPGEVEKEDENKDEGDQDKKDGDQKEDEEGKPKDDENQKKDSDPKNQKEKPQQQPGKLSPQQVKNLLEAMNNEEKKVQQKINAKKAKGKKVKAEKDW